MAGFEVYALMAGGGTLALSPVPGGGGEYDADLRLLLDWQPDLVTSLTPATELAALGAAGLGHDLHRVGIDWRPVPIADFGVPDAAVAALWPEISARAVAVLAGQGRVLVHCRGGCGRSGMVALRIMRACGEDATAALTRLRDLRPCAIETEPQMAWALG